MPNEIKHTPDQELIEGIKQDIDNIGCIYKTIGQAMFHEPRTRLAERIEHRVSDRHAAFVQSYREMVFVVRDMLNELADGACVGADEFAASAPIGKRASAALTTAKTFIKE